MRTLLHILTRPDDALAQEIIGHQQQSGEGRVIVVDLTESGPDCKAPDYKELLEKVFAAESVEVW